jgi:hypothetical protein
MWLSNVCIYTDQPVEEHNYLIFERYRNAAKHKGETHGKKDTRLSYFRELKPSRFNCTRLHSNAPPRAIAHQFVDNRLYLRELKVQYNDVAALHCRFLLVSCFVVPSNK